MTSEIRTEIRYAKEFPPQHIHTEGPVGSVQSAIKYQMRHILPQNNSICLNCHSTHMVIYLSAHTILVHFFFDNRSFVCQIFKSYYILHCAQATVSFILILCSVQYLVPRFFIMTLSKPKLWSSLM
jgi:hypothetical protein